MIGGILVGIGVAALIFFVVWLLKNGGKPKCVAGGKPPYSLC